MDWREDFDDGPQFQAFLRELISDGYIVDSMLGMAMKVIRGGVRTLTTGQAYVFKRDLIDAYATVCVRCGDEVPWDEVTIVRGINDGYCCRCDYRMATELSSTS